MPVEMNGHVSVAVRLLRVTCARPIEVKLDPEIQLLGRIIIFRMPSRLSNGLLPITKST